MTAIVADGGHSEEDGQPEVLMVYFPSDSCEVINTWNVLGMRGTGSNDISVSDVFVPKTRTFPFVPDFSPGSHYQGPLYRFPLMGVVACSIAPVMLAVARRAIDEVSALAQGKTPVATTTLLRDRASAQAKLAHAEAMLRSGRLLLYDTLSDAWEVTLAGETHSLSQKADLLLALTHAATCATAAVEMMYSMVGTSGIRTSSPLERYVRDIQVLKHHVLAA